MHILLIICFLVITTLQILYLVAAACFLFVLIDIPCSVVVLWKMRRKEREFLAEHPEPEYNNNNNDNNKSDLCYLGPDGWEPIADRDKQPNKSDLKESRIAADEGHSSKYGEGMSIERKQPQKWEHQQVQSSSSSSSKVVVLPKSKNNSKEVVETDQNKRNKSFPPSSDKDNPLLEGEDKIVNKTSKDDGTCCSSCSGCGGTEGSSLSPTSAFQEMFPLGACIIVLTIYLITRRKTYLRLPLPVDVPSSPPPPVVERPAPIIELLDVLKGDTTSRLLRVAPGVVISNRYLVEREIGRGGFSKVYLGKDQKFGSRVAIKTASRLLNQTKSLKKELEIYKDLQSSSSNLSIPYLIHYTEVDIKRMAILVMDLLGPSLEDVFKACDFKFSQGTVVQIMSQVLDILKYFHGKTYIHRDIKPENILIGRLGTADAHRIYLIDFGVVTTWCNTVNGKHVRLEYRTGRFGTNSYMSMNSHRGKTTSRKDDLEALGYCMYRFLKVNFPWIRYEDMGDSIKCIVTAKMKNEMNFAEEFPPPEYPKEFSEYMQYVKGLAFDATPDYDMLIESFRNLMERLTEEGWDGLEWTKPEMLQKLPEWVIPE